MLHKCDEEGNHAKFMSPAFRFHYSVVFVILKCSLLVSFSHIEERQRGNKMYLRCYVSQKGFTHKHMEFVLTEGIINSDLEVP